MILYITVDGLLEPLGRSQVLRYIEKLGERGWEFAVLSLERSSDLEDVERVGELEEELRRRGVDWIRLEYQQGGARQAAANIVNATVAALDYAASVELTMIHARSYVSGMVAAVLEVLLGVPYLFDIRGYWIDEKLDEGRWFTNPAIHKFARLVERALYRRSAGVVSLATPAAEDIRNGRFGAWNRPLDVIPTCVDPDEFVNGSPVAGCVPADVVRALADRLVVGYIGSINSSYQVREGFELFRGVLAEDPRARLLCLTGQVGKLVEMLDEVGIPEHARIVRRVPHEDVAMWLRLVDWGLLLLYAPFSKRASMPTKLGEFFATGVRPIVYGCNDDVRDWAEASGTGIVLRDTTPASLRAAAREIVRLGKSDRAAPDLLRARDITMSHFSLQRGVERYDRLYRAVLQSRPLPSTGGMALEGR